MALADKAILTTLRISQWTARKLNKDESNAVARTNGAVSGSARVNVALLPGADALEHIQKLAGEIRQAFYKNTAPWSDGVSILNALGFMAFRDKMATYKTRWDSAVADFVREYPQLVADAQLQLGALYKPYDYPPVAEVADKFRFQVRFLPVPEAGDWRVDLGDEEVADLRKQVEEATNEAQADAMKAVWQRVYDVVSKAVERLSNPDNIFKNTLVENARDLCEILPSINITGDLTLEHIQQELMDSLCSVDADDLRKDTTLRRVVAGQMDNIMSKMEGFFA